jgi:hypothetical protein
MTEKSFYSDRPDKSFWKLGVAERQDDTFEDFYVPKFKITRETRVATAGSCFAQRVSMALKDAGCKIVDMEPFPKFMPDELARKFGHRVYSARYGNIYTTRQLTQLIAEARGIYKPADPVWERDGRFFRFPAPER